MQEQCAFNYCVTDGLILHSNCMKDLGVTLDCKLNFYCHVDYVLRILGLFRYVTYNLSSLDSLFYVMPYLSQR